MSHFSDETWTDWARGVATSDVGTEIRDHLALGCAECSHSLVTWQGVAQLASRELAYDPPERVVRRAVSLFETHAPTPPAITEQLARVAELVYDSFRSPLPEGVRSLERATRHVSYKAGNYFVDVRIEEANSAGRAAVVGQLMHHPDASSLSLEGLSVVVTTERSTVAETTTNRFGEFAFEMEPHRDANKPSRSCAANRWGSRHPSGCRRLHARDDRRPPANRAGEQDRSIFRRPTSSASSRAIALRREAKDLPPSPLDHDLLRSFAP